MLKAADKFKKGDVAAFRLVTSDEIIGEVVEVEGDEISIKKPCTLAMGQDGNVGLTPAAMLADPEKPVIYFRTQIVAVMTPRPDAETAYKTFATGIQLATAPASIVTK